MADLISKTEPAATPAKKTPASPVTAALPLADPDDRPDADVVIFDGDCQFCQKQVQRLNRFDRGGRLAFISLHDPRVAARYPDLDHDQLMEQMYVCTTAGNCYGGAEAFRYLSRRLPLLWWLAPLMHIPFSLPLWQWLYRQIAVRRYRWNRDAADEACENGACEIHFREK